jgi:cell shape-determining protein MreC
MKDSLKTYENRIAKLRYRLKHFRKGINDFKELSKEIRRLNKIIQAKKDR